MQKSIQQNIIVSETFKIDNSNNDIIGLSVINLGQTSCYYDGLEIKKNEERILIYPTIYPLLNSDLKVEFNNDQNTGNKIFLSIQRLMPKKCN